MSHPHRESSLHTGQVLAGRFRIARLLGAGGMGEVYEAEDLELREAVALKTVLPALLSDPRALDAFKREVQMARQVTHPCVCRIFDFFRIQPDTAAPALAFVSMELLSGRTLEHRIREEGPVSPAEALPLVEQMVEGLSAAHRAGIVHCDFKSANVMLVPSVHHAGGIRAVVTDFGIAHRVVSDRTGATTMDVGSLVAGTPAYMAPEQVEGRPVTPAADIYALGVVVFEMMTARLPFVGETPLAAAAKRLSEDAPSPRTIVPTLDPRWDSVILRCLSRRVEDRYARVDDIPGALRGIDWTNAPAPRRSIAVLGFKNLSGRPDATWLSTALTELFSSELAAGRMLRVVPGETVARMKVDLALPENESYGRDTLGRLRANIGAELVVLGSYLVHGASGQIRLDLRLQDTATGETVGSIIDTGSEQDLFALISKAGARLREQVGVAASPLEAAPAVRAAVPLDPLAARAYAEGVAELRRFNPLRARTLLERTIELEPGHALAHAALSDAWSRLGYDREARLAAEHALALSAALSREDRLLIEGRLHAAVREWQRAADVYSTLWRLYPDDIEYGLSLAEAQSAAGSGLDALQTVGRLRAMSNASSIDPRISLAEAEAALSISDYARALSAVTSAIANAETLGAGLLVAKAKLIEAAILGYGQGEYERADHAADHALRLFEDAGDHAGTAAALSQSSSIAWNRGDLHRAERMAEQASRLARSIGSENLVARITVNRTAVAMARGALAEGLRDTDEALALYRSTDNLEGISRCMNNRGAILQLQGRLEEAEATYYDALRLKRRIGDKAGESRLLHNLAEVKATRGRLSEAHALYEDALALARATGNRSRVGKTLTDLADTTRLAGDLDAAEQLVGQALRTIEQIGAARLLAEALLVSASLKLDQARPQDASTAAAQAAAAFRREKMPGAEGLALLLIVRAALACGDLASAERTLEDATGLLEGTELFVSRVRLALVRGMVLAALGDGEGHAVVRSMRTVAAETGHVELELEARLALVQGGASDSGTQRHEELAALHRDALRLGFGGIAARAQHAMTS